jgi:hypothetical protein
VYIPSEIANYYFDRADGEYVVWLSDDDLLKPKFVKLLTSQKCKACNGVGHDWQAYPCVYCQGTGKPPAVYCSVERVTQVGPDRWQFTNMNWALEPWQYGSSDGGSMVLRKACWDDLGWRFPVDWSTAAYCDQLYMKAVHSKYGIQAVQDVLLTHRTCYSSTHQRAT